MTQPARTANCVTDTAWQRGDRPDFDSFRCLICRQRYHGATGSMSHASTTAARAAPPTANSRTAVLSARVG